MSHLRLSRQDAPDDLMMVDEEYSEHLMEPDSDEFFDASMELQYPLSDEEGYFG